MKKRGSLLLGLLLMGLLCFPGLAEEAPAGQTALPSYGQALTAWQKQGYAQGETSSSAAIETFIASGGAKAALETVEGRSAVKWGNTSGELTFTLEVEKAGLYNIGVTYTMLDATSGLIERGVLINGEAPFAECGNMLFSKQYHDLVYPFERNEYNNEVLPRQEAVYAYSHTLLSDRNALYSQPLQFYFLAGENTITFTGLKGSLAIAEVSLEPPHTLVDYSAYSEANRDKAAGESTLITVEAEAISMRSGKNIQNLSVSEPGISPEAMGYKLLNTIGGANWKKAHDWIEWTFEVPQDGFYQLAFNFKQNFNTSLSSFRRVEIDGQVPFAELLGVGFPFDANWQQKVLGDDTPYDIYLEAGSHTLRLTAVAWPYREVYERLRAVNGKVKEMDLRIKEIIGNDADVYRLWKLEQYIPTIAEDLAGYVAELRLVSQGIFDIVGESNELGNLNAAIMDLEKLAGRHNDIAKEGNALSNIYTVFSDWEDSLNSQPLLLDRFMVKSGSQSFPAATPGFFSRLWYGIRNFGTSFSLSSENLTTDDEDVVTVWVQRNRDYVDLMQMLADEYFTKETGIKVKVSYCPPGTQLLILANAAGDQPDVVTGVDIAVPFEFGMRNALRDLRSFSDFEEVIKNVVPGSRIPNYFNGAEYGIAEEVRVNVLYYRSDVLDRLEVPVPGTWNETTLALSTLLQNNYNMYYPYGDYLTFFFQTGVNVYSEDATDIAFATPEGFAAFRYWTELYTKYGMQPEMTSFYQHFRIGDVPLGIASIDQFVLFDIAAPDISGLWDVAPAPGTIDGDGQLNRYQAGTQTCAVMFKTNEERENRAWEFMRWWFDTETQYMFADDLENYYGAEFRWYSANTEVVARQAWPDNAKEVILQQLSWYKQLPMVPGGSYFTSREVWNAWTRTVIDKKNYREQLEVTISDIRNELHVKQYELGFVDADGNPLTPMDIMTITEAKGGADHGTE